MSKKESNFESTIGYLVLYVLFAAALFLIFVAVAFCAAMTVVCIWAWNKERRVFGEVITPTEARTFVVCGVIGAVMFGGGGLMLAPSAHQMGTYLQYCSLTGYVVGSLGWLSLYVKQVERENAKAAPPPSRLAQPLIVRPRDPSEKFEYASWDDEDRAS